MAALCEWPLTAIYSQEFLHDDALANDKVAVGCLVVATHRWQISLIC